MKNLWKNKKSFVIAIALLIGIVGTATTYALLVSTTDTVRNQFSLADVNTHIEEDFGGEVRANTTVKKVPTIKNDGPSDAFIRARVTISPVSDQITLLCNHETGATDVVLGTDSSVLYGESGKNYGEEVTDIYGWYYLDGWYYFNTPTSADPNSIYNVTEALFDAVEIGNVTRNFDVTVSQDAVYAEGIEPGTTRTAAEIKALFDAVNTTSGTQN